jgi:hypothetical protein
VWKKDRCAAVGNSDILFSKILSDRGEERYVDSRKHRRGMFSFELPLPESDFLTFNV